MSQATGAPRTVLAFGELLWDVIKTPEGDDYKLGGAPGNFCHCLSRLRTTAKLVTRVGKDDLGDRLLREVGAAGVDVSLVQRDDRYPTGTVDVTLNEERNPRFVINKNVAYDQLERTAELMEAAKGASLIYFGTLVQRSEQTRTVLYEALDSATQAVKFVDINLRQDCYTAETVRNSMKRASIVKLNEKEVGIVSQLFEWEMSGTEEQIQDRVANRLMSEFGVKHVLLTLGDIGVRGYTAQGDSVVVPGVSVTVADTIGAGDSFSGGFVHAYLKGATFAGCCRFGNLMGALTASHHGGMPQISPTALRDFVGAHEKDAELLALVAE